jgi:hypothetical protein
MLSSSTPRPVSRAVAQSFAHAGPSVASFAPTLPVFPFCTDDGGCSTSTTRTTAVPSNTRRILSASQGCTRCDEGEFVEWGDEDSGEQDDEPEKACQNALPRRWVRVCEAIDASAACCGVGDDDDAEVEVEPSLGVEGGVGYVDAREDVSVCLPLREAELRRAAAEEK